MSEEVPSSPVKLMVDREVDEHAGLCSDNDSVHQVDAHASLQKLNSNLYQYVTSLGAQQIETFEQASSTAMAAIHGKHPLLEE